MMRTSSALETPTAIYAPALLATLGLGTAGWLVAIARMKGMDMGTATTLGSFPFFISVWVPMMAAMMLPASAPSALGRSAFGLTRFLGEYLAVWTLFGVAAFALYRPHGNLVAGVITTAAGLYELTPVKRRFREMGQERRSSGAGLGACCVASTAGLMLVMLALGPMSLTWMALVAATVLVQKLAPPNALIDIPVAVAILSVAVAQFVK